MQGGKLPLYVNNYFIYYNIMDTIIDIFNNQLVYNKNNINYVIDIENNIKI